MRIKRPFRVGKRWLAYFVNEDHPAQSRRITAGEIEPLAKILEPLNRHVDYTVYRGGCSIAFRTEDHAVLAWLKLA